MQLDPASSLYQWVQLLTNSTTTIDKTIGSTTINVDSTVKRLSNIPVGTTRIVITVNGTDVIYTDDPTVSITRGYRLVNKQIHHIYPGNFTNFQFTRYTGADSSIYVEYKTTIVTPLPSNETFSYIFPFTLS